MNEIMKIRGGAGARAALLIALLAIGGCGDDTADAAGETEAADAEAAHVPASAVVLDPAAIEAANIVVEPVETASDVGLAATGTITYDANQVSHIGPRASGRIVTLFVDLGQGVGAGQPLAILESPEVGQIRAELHEAEALVRIAGENHQRETRLQEQGISSRKELLDAEAELRRSEAALMSARERLAALGAGEGTGGQFAVTAPFPGVVVERDASLGEMVNPEDQLFTVANLSELWMELDIYERDLVRVARGQRVDVSTAAYPGRAFPGTVSYVGDIVDRERRTIRTRVEIPNRDRALRPGMFATARIGVAREGAAIVMVPQQAVQEMDGRSIVFVPGAQAGEFLVRPVEVGEIDEAGRIAVLSGLGPDDRVVVSGAFALRSELSKDELSEEGH